MGIKKVPSRRCTGCYQMKDKKELIRIVRNKDNEFFIDTTAKMSGRGAYICNNLECLEKSFKNKGLERSFKCAVDKNIYSSLIEQLGGQHGK